MNIYIFFEGARQGPFTSDELTRQIRSGILPSSVLAWHEGIEDWKPLSSISGFENIERIVTDKEKIQDAIRSSKVGKFSFKAGIYSLMLSAIATVAWGIFLAILCAVGDPSMDTPLGLALLVATILCLTINGLGFILGLIGLHSYFQKRPLALLGAILNVLVFSGAIFILIQICFK